MKLSHIEHIGIAVKDLAVAIPYYEKVLGLTCYNIEEVKEQIKFVDGKVEFLALK